MRLQTLLERVQYIEVDRLRSNLLGASIGKRAPSDTCPVTVVFGDRCLAASVCKCSRDDGPSDLLHRV